MGDAYRRLRNTLRYLLGALAGFSPERRSRRRRCRSWSAGCCTASPSSTGSCARRIAEYDFHALFTALHNFCAVDLSAFYFDIRKDRLYCDAADDPAGAPPHRAGPHLRLPGALARADPVLHRRGGLARALRRRARAQHPSRTVRRGPGRNGMTRHWAARWAELRDLRRVVTGALEVERAAEAHRVEPAGGGRDLRARALVPRCATSISPSCASPRPERCKPARRRRTPSPCPMCRISASS
jgi:isoleucyl-tRNA synthetase